MPSTRLRSEEHQFCKPLVWLSWVLKTRILNGKPALYQVGHYIRFQAIQTCDSVHSGTIHNVALLRVWQHRDLIFHSVTILSKSFFVPWVLSGHSASASAPRWGIPGTETEAVEYGPRERGSQSSHTNELSNWYLSLPSMALSINRPISPLTNTGEPDVYVRALWLQKKCHVQ